MECEELLLANVILNLEVASICPSKFYANLYSLQLHLKIPVSLTRKLALSRPILISISPLFLAICPLKSLQLLLIAIYDIPFPSLHLTPAVSFLLLLLQLHCFFLFFLNTLAPHTLGGG